MKLTEADVTRAYIAADELRRVLAEKGPAVPAWLDALCRKLRLITRTVSTDGHEIAVGSAQLKTMMLTTAEKARELGLSERHVRRRAEELGGVRFTGWMFPMGGNE